MMKPTPLLPLAAFAISAAVLVTAWDSSSSQSGQAGTSGQVTTLRFKRACEPGERATIAGTGDVLLHSQLQEQADASPARFRGLWEKVEPLIAKADIAYANLEGPVGGLVNESGEPCRDPGNRFDGVCYTGYPLFNYPDAVPQDLEESGFGVVSTANNHAMDRRSIGVDHTVEALERSKLPFSGTRRRGDNQSPWYAITRAGKLNVAWLACATYLNDNPDPEHQVLQCYLDRPAVLKLIHDLSKRADIDAVIVTPHWGEEYEESPRPEQEQFGAEALEAGAAAVIGNHPHVLQPIRHYVTRDGREGVIAYSMGNFVSHQRELPKRTEAMLYLGLTRPERGGKAYVNGLRFVPLVMNVPLEPAPPSVGGYFVEPSEPTGTSAPFYRHALEILGVPGNVMGPDDELDTIPECRS